MRWVKRKGAKHTRSDQVSRTHPRSGRAPGRVNVEVDSGDLKRLIIQGTHGVDFEPRGRRVLRGQGVGERHRVARRVGRGYQLLGVRHALRALGAGDKGDGVPSELRCPPPSEFRSRPLVPLPNHTRPALDVRHRLLLLYGFRGYPRAKGLFPRESSIRDRARSGSHRPQRRCAK